MNYIDKYNEYVSFLKTDKYKKYIDSLHLFFNNNPNQLCPQCNKPTIIKSYNNGIIFMKCTQSKCDWKMSIEVAEYINLDNTIYKNKKISKDLLYSLLNTDNFTAVKNEYLNEKNKINYINEIFKIQQK
jgi:Zn-finger nucleic acid-binding protein